ncbi:(4Fe-4S)-binding protein [Escherichia coli]
MCIRDRIDTCPSGALKYRHK